MQTPLINRQPNPQPSFTDFTPSKNFTHPLKQTHRQPGPRIDDQRRARDIRRRRTAPELNAVGYLVGLQWHDGLDHVLEVWVEDCFLRVHGAGYPGWTDGVDADAVGGVVDCCLGGEEGVSFVHSCELSRIMNNTHYGCRKMLLAAGFRNPHNGVFGGGIGCFPGEGDDGIRGAETHNAAAAEGARGVAALVGAWRLRWRGYRGACRCGGFGLRRERERSAKRIPEAPDSAKERPLFLPMPPPA
ncbi:hypothetical protein H4I96_01588 [Botrytis cinerea]